MEYKYEVLVESKIIKVAVFGDLSQTETSLLSQIFRIKAFEMKYKLLFDYTFISTEQISISMACFWYQDYYTSGNTEYRNIQTAYLLNEGAKSVFDFIETTCYDTEDRIRLFMEYEKALEWLNYH